MTAPAPKGLRLHIALFGRRNVGKSSLLNAITRQQVSIVSPIAGTTTDPVEKPMELLPLGRCCSSTRPASTTQGALGELRVQKTRQVLDRTDLGVWWPKRVNGASSKSRSWRELAGAEDPRDRGVQ